VRADRTRGWLGELGGGGATVELSELGRLVEAKWLELAANWPGVEVADYVIMPDHLHGILRIRRRQAHPLGQIVGSFKARSTSEVRRGLAGELASKLASTMPPSGGLASTVPGSLLAGTSLWAEGLTDSILWTRERYERAKAYIADNPRRLALKRNHPELFAIRRDFAVPLALGDDGKEVACRFAAIGNAALLNSVDFHQVQCSRRYFAYARDQYGKPLREAAPTTCTPEFAAICNEAIAAAKAGAVLVNPCISHGEREIARRAFVGGVRMIVLKNQGFAPLYKPEGALFDALVAGRLLMLAPGAWPYQTQAKPMTREDACALNRLAQAIAREGAAEIDYKGLKPNFIDRSAKEACLAAA
ncbi:MAG: hypothetical protein J6P80_03870, partial [Kiritimatiellae bacterium]|nr:hypothetical protein [Kiritimatiellia bacterium]